MQNYFITKTADVALVMVVLTSQLQMTRLNAGGGLLGGLLSILPPELRRAGQGLLGDLKRRIPIGDLTGGRVFPPFF